MYPVDTNDDSLDGSTVDKNHPSGRAPKCRRCRNHNVLSDLRGHKHQCRFKDCMCSKCVIVTDGQKQTAVRIALYRQQRSLENDVKVDVQGYENGVEGNSLWRNGLVDDKGLENGYGKRKYNHSSDSGSNSPGSDLSSSTSGAKRPHLDSPPTIRDGACAASLPMPHDVLSRAFPNHSTTILDLVLKGCNGNVLHAIEIITQYDKIPRMPLPTMPGCMDPNVPVANSLMPPLYKMNAGYRFLVPPGMIPLGSYMFPGAPPTFGCVPPPTSAFPVHGEPPENHDERGTHNGEVLSPKKEVENEQEHCEEPTENGVPRCQTCGNRIHFGDRFCTNCTRRYSS